MLLTGGISAGAAGGLAAAAGPIGAVAAAVPLIIRGIKLAKTPEGKQVFRDFKSGNIGGAMRGSLNLSGLPINIPEEGVFPSMYNPQSSLLKGGLQNNSLYKNPLKMLQGNSQDDSMGGGLSQMSIGGTFPIPSSILPNVDFNNTKYETMNQPMFPIPSNRMTDNYPQSDVSRPLARKRIIEHLLSF
jgi:hypothetical protein